MNKEPIDFSLEELLVLAEGEQRNVRVRSRILL